MSEGGVAARGQWTLAGEGVQSGGRIPAEAGSVGARKLAVSPGILTEEGWSPHRMWTVRSQRTEGFGAHPASWGSMGSSSPAHPQGGGLALAGLNADPAGRGDRGL